MMDPVYFKSLILLYMVSLEERRGFKKKEKKGDLCKFHLYDAVFLRILVHQPNLSWYEKEEKKEEFTPTSY